MKSSVPRSSKVMEVNGSSQSLCYVGNLYLARVLYLPKYAIFSAIGQIKRGAVKYGNKSTLLTIDLAYA